MSDKNVLITGGGGRLGTVLTKQLHADGYAVTVLDKRDPQIDGVAYVDIDIVDLDALTDAFRGFDRVVHLAAVPNPRTSSPKECFRVNTQGTWTALQAAEDAGVRRVIVISSDAATGLHYNPENWRPQYLPVDETHPIRPTEVYSLTKEITESIAVSFAHRGKVEVIAIRPGHIVFEPEYPELASRGADVQNYHLWGYVAPEDVSQGIQLAMEHPDGSYDCIFLGAADGLNTRPTLELFRERFGVEPEVRGDVFEKNPQAGIFDIRHAQEKLGYAPKLTWRDFNKS